MGVCSHFKVPTMVCINKYDINAENTRQIESMSQDMGSTIAAWIPYDNAVTEALVRGIPVVQYSKEGAAKYISSMWLSILDQLTN